MTSLTTWFRLLKLKLELELELELEAGKLRLKLDAVNSGLRSPLECFDLFI